MLSDYQISLAEFNKIPPGEIDAFPAERCSNNKQVHGSTWFRQDLVLTDSSQMKGWNYRSDAPVIDKNKSGFFEENFEAKAQLMRFLAAAKAGKIKKNRTVLMFAHENRFTRAKIGNGMAKLREMVASGVYIYFANSDLLLLPGWEHDAKILDHLTRAFDAARKEVELRQTYSFYSHKKKHADLEAGLIVNTGNYPQWIEFEGPSSKLPGKYVKSDKRVFPGTDNPLTKWDVVVRIKNEAVAGCLPIEIATGLNHDKIPCFLGGKMWRSPQVIATLRSKLLLGIATLGGTLTPDRKKKIKGTKEFHIYPPVCTPEEWNTIQHGLAKNADLMGPHPKRGGVNSLFPSRLFCSVCGGLLGVDAKYPLGGDGKKDYSKPVYRTYRCRDHAQAGKCPVSQSMPAAQLEEDFLWNFLQQDATALLDSQDDELRKHQQALEEQIRALKSEIADYQTAMQGATGATAKKAVMDLINKPATLLEQKVIELDKISDQPLTTVTADAALNTVQEALRNLEADPTNVEAWRTVELTMDMVRKQLDDTKTRRKLADHIPDLIGGLVVDLANKHYSIKNLQGKIVATRDLSVVLAAIRKEGYRLRSLRIRATRIKNGTDRGFKVRKKYTRRPITEETRAKLSKAHKASWEKRRQEGRATFSAETKASMSEAGKAVWKKRREEGTTDFAWKLRRERQTDEQVAAVHSAATKKAWAIRRKNGTDRGYKLGKSTRVWKPGEGSAHVRKSWITRKKNLKAKKAALAQATKTQVQPSATPPPPHVP